MERDAVIEAIRVLNPHLDGIEGLSELELTAVLAEEQRRALVPADEDVPDGGFQP